MIALATSHVVEGRYSSPFKYILVDEFQDMASGRARLLLALRDQVKGTRLFCVGDDWQSIYRFTGSDISFMTQFSQNFGYTKRTDLDRTFRFNNKIEHLSTRFISKNPTQLNKELQPNSRTKDPCIFLYLRQRQQDALGDILAEIYQNSDTGRSVFVLTRYNFQIPTQDVQDTLAAQFPRLKISFITAHSSKGLEADYVIVDKLNSGRYGFPTEITDDPLLDLVLPAADQYENGEERRLFYVAVTRARKRVYLVADVAYASAFVHEILKDKNYDVSVCGDLSGSPVLCPSCQSGFLVPRTNEVTNVLFYGCSNYPLCTYAEDACPHCRRGPFLLRDEDVLSCVACGHEARVCQRCKRGRMVKRHGRYGEFYGCTMYSSEMLRCNHTENIESHEFY